jgi:phosphohistidine swiveling domain-containing protein
VLLLPRDYDVNDSLRGNDVWTSGNVGEAIPDVMTPCTWSAFERSSLEAIGPRTVAGRPLWGTIAGRLYFNLSTTVSLARRFGSSAMIRELSDQSVGPIPAGVDVPLVRLPLWASFRDAGIREVRVQAAAVLRRRGALRAATAMPRRAAEVRAGLAAIRTEADLAAAWRSSVEPLFADASALLRFARPEVMQMTLAHRLLRRLIGAELANAVTTGGNTSHLASLDLLVGLERLSRGDIDRDTFAREHGHRGPHEYELSLPRPGEDPTWIDRQVQLLEASAQSPTALLHARARQCDDAWLAVRDQRGRVRTGAARSLARRWAGAARRREHLRSASVHGSWTLRAFVQRAGALTGHGDDLWLLTLDEIVAVLDGDTSPLDRIPARRATHDLYTSLPRPPALLRGPFDPVHWAGSVDDRPGDGGSDGEPEPLSGWPGAAGVVEATARVIIDLDGSDALQPGEILVTPFTNVGWTPVLLHAAAVVTDIGAPLSHAAIVARELGIPAVVGCRDATARIASGDTIRVDGANGTVTVLCATGRGR